MKKLKRDLKSLQKSLDALSEKVEKMLLGLPEPEEAAAVPKKRRQAIKKTVKKRPAVKKSATQMVLDIIQSNGKGVDTATLKQETGFEERKIWGIVNRLKKQGKVRSGDRGMYEKA